MAFIGITRKSKPKPAKTAVSEFPKVAKDTIGLTEAAVNRIREMAQNEGRENDYFRIGIKGGGCSGFTNHLAFDKNVRPNDKVIDIHGISVCIDLKSLSLIGGSVLDFESELMKRGFKLVTPNKTKSCSCGESFSF